MVAIYCPFCGKKNPPMSNYGDLVVCCITQYCEDGPVGIPIKRWNTRKTYDDLERALEEVEKQRNWLLNENERLKRG